VATFSLSMLVHGALLSAVLVGPLLLSDSLPAPVSRLQVFFAPPLAVPPPPPPAAPRAPSASPRRLASAPRPVLAAPVEIPERVLPGEILDPGAADGVPGGVEGGVPGGVVGAVVAGLPEAPPPQPVRVGGQIREPAKLRHVDPAYPDVAVRAGVQGIVILECSLDPQGRVVDVRVLRGLPLLTEPAIAAVKQWAYTPTLLDGVPVPVILPVTVRFALGTGRPFSPA
jgi:protein TonB